jgi:predicted aspartyl protease
VKFAYDTNYEPPAPSMEIHLAFPESSYFIGPLIAFVDSGADATIIPSHYLRGLSIQVDDRKLLRSAWGERRIVDIHYLDVGIGAIRLPVIEVVADELSDEIIIGRNILNKLLVVLNGPAQTLEMKD